jgi:hypothetical protein
MCAGRRLQALLLCARPLDRAPPFFLLMANRPSPFCSWGRRALSTPNTVNVAAYSHPLVLLQVLLLSVVGTGSKLCLSRLHAYQQMG